MFAAFLLWKWEQLLMQCSAQMQLADAKRDRTNKHKNKPQISNQYNIKWNVIKQSRLSPWLFLIPQHQCLTMVFLHAPIRMLYFLAMSGSYQQSLKLDNCYTSSLYQMFMFVNISARSISISTFGAGGVRFIQYHNCILRHCCLNKSKHNSIVLLWSPFRKVCLVFIISQI